MKKGYKKPNLEKESFHIIDFKIAEGYYLYKDKIKVLFCNMKVIINGDCRGLVFK